MEWQAASAEKCILQLISINNILFQIVSSELICNTEETLTDMKSPIYHVYISNIKKNILFTFYDFMTEQALLGHYRVLVSGVGFAAVINADDTLAQTQGLHTHVLLGG